MVHHSSYEFNRNPETETEYKRLSWWSRRLQKEWREDNPNEVWLPFLLKTERTIYGDIKKLDSGEIKKRNRMVRDKIMDQENAVTLLVHSFGKEYRQRMLLV